MKEKKRDIKAKSDISENIYLLETASSILKYDLEYVPQQQYYEMNTNINLHLTRLQPIILCFGE